MALRLALVRLRYSWNTWSCASLPVESNPSMLPNSSRLSGVMPCSISNSRCDSVPCATFSAPYSIFSLAAMRLASRAVSNMLKYWRSPSTTTSTVYWPKRDSGA